MNHLRLVCTSMPEGARLPWEMVLSFSNDLISRMTIGNNRAVKRLGLRVQRNGDIDLHIQLSQVKFIQFKQAEKISFCRGWSDDDERLFRTLL